MRTNFPLRNKPRKIYGKHILIVVLIFVFGVIVFSLSAGGLLRVLTPVWRAESAIVGGFRNLFSFFRSKDSLIKENQNLQEKIVSDEILLVSTQTSAESQNALFRSLGRAVSGKGISAAVLVHPPETPYDILIIDVGTDDGVVMGQEVSLAVDSSSGQLGPKIGVITEVYKKNSRVLLFSASGEKTNAILERNSVPVVLIGRGGGNFEFTLPREADVVIGDKILSSDINRVLVGVVKDVEMEATDSFKKVLVISAANIYTENFVTVLP